MCRRRNVAGFHSESMLHTFQEGCWPNIPYQLWRKCFLMVLIKSKSCHNSNENNNKVGETAMEYTLFGIHLQFYILYFI